MIVFGGQSAGPLNDLWVFDFATNAWTRASTDNPPSGRFFTTSFVDSGGSYLVFGGSTSSGNTNETWSHDFGNQQWTRLEIPNPPLRRNSMMGTLVAEDHFIIFGGSGSEFLNDIWELNVADEAQLWFAQFGNGGGLVSEIVLTNPSSTDQIAGSVDFFDENGLALPIGIAGTGPEQVLLTTTALPSEVTSGVDFSIPPLGTVTISTDGTGNAVAGAAVVTSVAPLGGVIRFSIPNRGIAGVGASEPVSGFIAPARRKLGSINTGIAIHNTESQSVNLKLTLRTAGGMEIAETTIENFTAREHRDDFIDKLFPNTDTEDFEGTLVVQVTGGEIVATALELGVALGQFTTLPVTPLN